MIFPTRFKFKIGKAFSWPIGAESVSSVLADVPQEASLKLMFYEADGTWRGYGWLPAVFVAEYRYVGPSLSSPRGSLDDAWRLKVHAVPRKLRHRVRTLLLSDGLPLRVRPWLMEREIRPGQEGEASITLRYDEDADSLIQEQTLKLRPITG